MRRARAGLLYGEHAERRGSFATSIGHMTRRGSRMSRAAYSRRRRTRIFDSTGMYILLARVRTRVHRGRGIYVYGARLWPRSATPLRVLCERTRLL